MVENYCIASSCNTTIKAEAWTKPPVDCFKVNVDAGFLEDDLRGTTGAVIRNSHGEFVAARMSLMWSRRKLLRPSVLLPCRGQAFRVAVEVDIFSILNLGLDVVNGVRAFNLWCDGLASECLLVTPVTTISGVDFLGSPFPGSRPCETSFIATHVSCQWDPVDHWCDSCETQMLEFKITSNFVIYMMPSTYLTTCSYSKHLPFYSNVWKQASCMMVSKPAALCTCISIKHFVFPQLLK